MEGADWSLSISLAAIAASACIIAIAGRYLVAAADEVADRTGAGEAVIGAVLLGATTSLADITAVVGAASDGYASMAVSAAVGGIAVQMAFLAVADITLRGVNLEHAAASLPNLVSIAVLILILSLVVIGTHGPDITVWQVHPLTLILFAAYATGARLILSGHSAPMWKPRLTPQTRVDDGSAEAASRSWRQLASVFLFAGGAVAVAGWALSESGEALMQELGLLETAVGGIVIATVTSLPELVTSVIAVRRGALTLAVGGVVGGNAFDTLLVGVADLAYRDGSVYHHIKPQDLMLTGLTLFMSAVLLLGLLLRQKSGPGNIGVESVLVLVAYATGLVLINLEY